MANLKSLALVLWLLALAVAGWVVAHLPLAAIARAITGVGPWQWLVWIFLNAIVIGLMTWRWQLLISAFSSSASFSRVLQIRQAGQVVSFLTPGPQFGGEPLQVYWLWKQAGLPARTALLSLGLDRYFELWVNFGVLFLALVLLLTSAVFDLSDWRGVVPVLGAVLLLLTVIGWVLLVHPRKLVAGLRRMTARWAHHPVLQRVDAHWEAVGDDLAQIAGEKRSVLVCALALSLLAWTGLLAELWFLLVLLNLQVTLAGFLVILVATRLAFLLPLPGAIGTLEAAVYWAFQGLSLPAGGALGLIALMRLRDAAILALGLACLYRVKK